MRAPSLPLALPLALALLLAAGCATAESRKERARAIRADADVAAKAIDAAAVRCEELPEPADRETALEEIAEARNALDLARSAAVVSAKAGDDGELSEIERVVDALRRWAEGFPTRR